MTQFFFKGILLVSLLLFNGSLFAQQEGIKFGNVTLSDLSQKTYPVDSTADAVVLYDYGYTYFTYHENTGISINTDYHTKKRVLSENATDLGILDIVYRRPDYKKGESVNFFKGRTYWLEGGQMKSAEVTSKDIFETKLQNSFYNKKVTFPHVTGDCIIEYSYTISTPMTIRDKPRPWYFQSKYPVVYSEYNIGFPNFLDYTLLMTGYLPLDEKKTEQRNMDVGHSFLDGMGSFQRYIMRNIPAFTEEPYISSRDNFISKIGFELVQVRMPGENPRDYSTTWKAMNSTLINSDNFGKVLLRKTGFLKDQVSRFNGIADRKERLRAAYKAWNGSFKIDNEQGSVFLADEQKKVLENRRGTPNQVNGLFISLLRELDLNATPVILSRRSNGAINRSFPMLDSFDYIIAKVTLGEESFLIDITDKAVPLGVLPFECLNLMGFEVKQGGGDFVDILPKAKYWETMSFTSEIDLESGRVKGSAERNYLGYSGVEVRRDYYSQGHDFNAEFKKKLGNYTIEDLDIRNLDDNSMPVMVKYSFGYEGEDLDDPEFIYFNPMLGEQVKKNPFTLEERLYPVDFGWTYEDVFSHTIKIPEGYEIESLPKSEGYALNDNSARYTYHVSAGQGTINVLARYYIKNPVYYDEAYHDLKELFSYMVKKGNEQIVLKKK